MRLGQTDAGTNPPDTTTRKAYDLIAEGFGPGFNGPLLLSVELTGDEAPTRPRSTGSPRASPAIPRVQVAAPAEINDAGDAAIVTVVPEDGAAGRRHHRAGPPPARRGGARGRRGHRRAGATSAASTAVFIDLSDKVATRLPLFIGAVVGSSFLLLMVVFRSVLVPLKAALMNLLSIGAAYGVVVAVFQWGWGKSLIGLERDGADRLVRADVHVRHRCSGCRWTTRCSCCPASARSTWTDATTRTRGHRPASPRRPG